MAQRDTTQPDQPKLDNYDQSMALLEQISPELAQMYQAMQYADLQPDIAVKFFYTVANVKRFSKYGVVSLNVTNGKESKIVQKQQFVIPQDDD